MDKENEARLILAKNLKKELIKHKMTVADLSKQLHFSDSTVRSWVNAEKYPRIEKLQQLADFFHITSVELIGKQPDNITIVTKTVKIPILGTIACGDPILAEENIEGYVDEPLNYLPSGKLFYLKAKGNSMSPTIPNKAKVLIRQQNNVEDGEIAAILLIDTCEATLKRIKHIGDNILLMPDNPNYDPIIIDKNNPIRILGKAVRMTTDF